MELREIDIVTVVGVASVVFASISLSQWFAADYFHGINTEYGVWNGYDPASFWGLFFFVFFSPIAIITLGITSQYWLKISLSYNYHYYIVAFVTFSALLSLLILGGVWSSDVITECFFGDGCIESSSHAYIAPDTAGTGWQISLGLFFLLGALPVTIAVVASFIYNTAAGRQGSADTQRLLSTSDNQPNIADQTVQLRHGWILYCILAPLLFLFFFFTSYLPNSSMAFNPIGISEAAKSTINPLSPPELPGSIFSTSTITINAFWTLKLFPDSVMFGIFLLAVPLCALALRSSHALRRFLSYKVRLVPPHVLGGSYWSVAELATGAATLLLIILFVIYWAHDHNFVGTYPTPMPNSAVAFRTLGQLAVLLMGLLFFPASRGFIMPLIFGVSWEQGMQYHRWLGSAFLLAVLGHMIAVWVWQYQNDMFTLFAVPLDTAQSVDNFTVPLQTLCAWLALLLVGVLAGFERVRRYNYELFLFAHRFSYLMLIPTVLWHAASGWMFILPGVGCWFVDACFRFYRGLRAVRVLGARVLELGKAGRITELRLEAPFQFSPGHYLFINVAQVSVSQWHPFTISSAGPDITLHIKDMGPGTWTNQLAGLVAAASESVSAASPRATHATDHSNIASLGLTVSLDGPCGLPIDFTQYESVILVAGGIGITPCKSIFEALQHSARHGGSLGALRHVHLLWIARDRRLFSELMSRSLELPPPQAAGCEFSAHLFTDDPDAATTETGLRPVSLLGPEAWSRLVEDGRPDLATELAAVPKPEDPARTIVFVCGPPGVASAVESIAFHHSWAFHTELFYL